MDMGKSTNLQAGGAKGWGDVKGNNQDITSVDKVRESKGVNITSSASSVVESGPFIKTKTLFEKWG